MLYLEARFLTGRVHATPWGHHVNEGLVEWPPSPWRLLRALLSAGFTRLGWTSVPVDARRLIASLGERAPTYHLPRATVSHTRHYMPVYKGSTTRVIDAFAHVDAPLVVELAVDLDASAMAQLDSLLASVPYLGRAESTVELRRIDRLPDALSICSASDAAPSREHEGVALLAPETPLAFQTWRDAAKREALEKLSASSNAKAPKKKEIEKLEAGLPSDVVDALLAATPDLQREGWSRPPGSRWLSYWRPRGCLEARPTVAAPPRRRSEGIDTALLALSSDTVRADVLPQTRDALYRMEAIHDTLVRESARGEDEPSPCFTGRIRGDRISGHRHATLIPLTLGRRQGRIDHVLVHAPMGFDANGNDERALKALGAIRRTYAKNLPAVFVVLAGLGTLADFEKAVPLVRVARTFQSVTPFVPPRHLKPKGKNSLLGQVLAELEARGLPPAARVELEVGDSEWAELTTASQSAHPWSRFRGFARRRSTRPPPVDIALSLRLSFDTDVRGPMTLGYGSHFGLGVFRPAG